MSMYGIVAKRVEIAAALSSVHGIRGYAYPPTAWKPGDAWPQWGGAAPGGDDGRYRTALVHEYRIVLVLAADQQTADAFVSGILDELLEVLAPHLAITGTEPARLTAEGSQAAHNALTIIGETE